jgi:hypothetical protein
MKRRTRVSNAAIEPNACGLVYVHTCVRMLKRICKAHNIRVRADQEEIEVLLRCYYAWPVVVHPRHPMSNHVLLRAHRKARSTGAQERARASPGSRICAYVPPAWTSCVSGSASLSRMHARTHLCQHRPAEETSRTWGPRVRAQAEVDNPFFVRAGEGSRDRGRVLMSSASTFGSRHQHAPAVARPHRARRRRGGG